MDDRSSISIVALKFPPVHPQSSILDPPSSSLLIHPFSQQHSHAAAPILIDPYPIDRYSRVNCASDQLSRLVKSKQRRNHIQKRGLIDQTQPIEISSTMKILPCSMPFDPQPIIERLKRKLGLLAYLELHHYQAALGCRRQNIYESPLFPAICRNLRVNKPSIKSRINGLDIPTNDRFQPTFGLKPKHHFIPSSGLWASSRNRLVD